MSRNMRRLAVAALAAVVVSGCAGGPDGSGVRTWPDGTRYEGELREGEPHGRGVMTMADGTRYEGEFRVGEPHGQVVMSGAVLGGNLRFEGEYRDGKPLQGNSDMTTADGTRFEAVIWDGKGVAGQCTKGRIDPGLRVEWTICKALYGAMRDLEEVSPETRASLLQECGGHDKTGVTYEGDTRDGLAHGQGVMAVTVFC